jgi:hypothetical protein
MRNRLPWGMASYSSALANPRIRRMPCPANAVLIDWIHCRQFGCIQEIESRSFIFNYEYEITSAGHGEA